MKRKTPIKHKVRGYTRDGRRVSGYTRGKGTKTKITKQLSNPKPKIPKGYTVTLKYSKKRGDKETVKVIAPSYQRAVDEALEEKMDKRHPIEIYAVDPSLGEVLQWAGSRAVKYGKAVAKKSYEFGKGTAKSYVSDWWVKQLIKQAYSNNKSERTLARAKLKRDYPHVWDIMDISKS